MTPGGSQLTGGRGADGTGISKNVNHGGSQLTFYMFRFTALTTTGEMSSDVFIAVLFFYILDIFVFVDFSNSCNPTLNSARFLDIFTVEISLLG